MFSSVKIRILFVAGALACILFAPAAPASASVGVTPTEAGAGATVDLTFTVTSDKDALATSRVAVTFPAAAKIEVADASSVAGWSSTIARDDSNKLSSVTWDQGKLDAGKSQAFVLTITLPKNQASLALSAIQSYNDGTVVKYSASDSPSLNISISGAVTTTALATTTTATSTTAQTTSTTTGASKDADSKGGFRDKVGFYLIVFGIIVILAIYARTKQRSRRG